MLPSPERNTLGFAQAPTLEVLEDLVSVELHAAAWAEFQSPKWRFGHGSTLHDPARFWTMDLQDIPVFDEIWRRAQSRCEALAETRLRVIRQYANGHTYGLGGGPHTDDHRPGTFTLLYYPNPQWSDGWDGETVFYDSSGEIARAVRPRPNRAILFDSRLLHVGRAPSRLCPELRVTVAFKLESTRVESAPSPQGVDLTEVSRDGASRVYAVCVPQVLVDKAVEERLTKLGQSIRLPGFRPGEIPRGVVQERYGAQTRHDVLKQLAVRILESELPTGSIVSSCDLHAGAEVGDMKLRVQVTHVPDLPVVDLSDCTIERLCPDYNEPSLEAADFMRKQLKSQVLDELDAQCPIPLLPGMVEREFNTLWRTVQDEAGVTEADVRAIAARRLRLGAIITEMGRRLGIDGVHGAELEDKVIDRFVAQARVQDRRITQAELQEMMKS